MLDEAWRNRVSYIVALTVCAVAAGGCGSKPIDPQQAEIDALEAKLAETERERIANLPKDRATLDMLGEAERYFKDPKWIWPTCRESAARLNEKGHPASALEILEASIKVMKRLGVRPAGDQSITEFCNLYEMRRVDPMRRDGRKGAANHHEAADLLVTDEKFGNNISPEVEKTRRMQLLTVGETVRLGSLDHPWIRTLDDNTSASIKIPNGTFAEIEKIVEDRYGIEHRVIVVRILEGPLTGHRFDMSPAQIIPQK